MSEEDETVDEENDEDDFERFVKEMEVDENGARCSSWIFQTLKLETKSPALDRRARCV